VWNRLRNSLPGSSVRFLAFLGTFVATGVLLQGCGGGDKPRPDIAFVSTRDGEYTIFQMNANGAAERRLTDADSDTSKPEGLFFQVEPAWSPDGNKIAFASARTGSFDIYVMNADGTGTRRLTSTKQDDGHPTWSPDGTAIAFSRGTPGDIYVMNSDGSNVRPLIAAPTGESEPAWSPDGTWIAYVQREPGSPVREVWVARSDGTASRRVTSLGASSLNPAWAPDSKRLAFASNVVATLYDIYVLTLGRKKARRLTREGPDTFEPSWSPDGALIAFAQGGSIRTVDLEGKTNELTDSDDNDSSPVWNPNPPPEAD
jgi:Tol biopolymer transport system component